MQIDWATLAAIAVVAAAATVTVVVLVAFAVLGLSTSAGRRVHGRTDASTALAVLCLLATCLIVCYGLYLIIA